MPDRIQARTAAQGPVVAYVLKSFPRLSETFITSEVYRLERAGVALRLFVLKREQAEMRHSLADRIASPVVHLPEAAPISEVTLLEWLRTHFAGFRPAVGRMLRRHPLRVARVAAFAAVHAVRARKERWGPPRKSPLKELLQALALADALHTAGDVTHVHAHFCHSATTVAWMASVVTGLPLSFTAHAKDVHCAELNPAGLLDRKLRAARFVVTCTLFNQRVLQARSTTPVYCLYHGLDAGFDELCRRADGEEGSSRRTGLERRVPTAGHTGPRLPGTAPRLPGAAPGRRTDPVRALAVGRLVAKKGFDVFVEACALLRARGLEVEATIVGEPGDEEQALRAQIHALRLHGIVTLAGPMPHDALFEQYRRSTVFCLPCRVLENGDRDGIPNVVAEAMAAGVPVVTTPVAGIPELLAHESNGLLVSPDDPRALANAIERLHAAPDLAARVTAAARQTIRERFDANRTIATLSRLFTGAAA